MSLLTYKDARPWAKSIATQVGEGTMPPWHADPKHGEFLNDRRLERRRQGDAGELGERRRAGRQAGGLAGAADLRQRLDDRHTRCDLRDERGLSDSGDRRDSVSVLRDRDQPHGRQVDPGVRGEGRRSKGRASRDRLRAAASRAGASAPRGPPRRRRATAGRPAQPAPLFDFAPNMEIPAGQTGGRRCRRSSASRRSRTSAARCGSVRPSAATRPASSFASIRTARR